jgi:hypothetical protein
MKQMAALNLLMVGLLFIVTAVYIKIPPPLVPFALIWVMIGAQSSDGGKDSSPP